MCTGWTVGCPSSLAERLLELVREIPFHLDDYNFDLSASTSHDPTRLATETKYDPPR